MELNISPHIVKELVVTRDSPLCFSFLLLVAVAIFILSSLESTGPVVYVKSALRVVMSIDDTRVSFYDTLFACNNTVQRGSPYVPRQL